MGDVMELAPGKVAVVTGAASGIGLALAHRFAAAGMHVVLADVEVAALDTATAAVAATGVQTHAVVCDVRHAAEVDALAASAVERFGAVHVVCNNAGVAGGGDAWFGSINTWDWVLGVNLYGVIHGVRAFLPHLFAAGGGHIVNTASIAGLLPGFSPPYDASKHAVVGMTEALYHQMQLAGGVVGVSCLCPGWVRTSILDADRNFPADLGTIEQSPVYAVVRHHVDRAIAEGATPAAVADLVAQAVQENRFWVFPQRDFLELAIRRWETIGEGVNPTEPEQVPGMPPAAQLNAEVLKAMGIG
jgi:NAD(P)-dependent dehydrogenase (short-subunit alcohol dehydrogenase family)